MKAERKAERVNGSSGGSGTRPTPYTYLRRWQAAIDVADAAHRSYEQAVAEARKRYDERVSSADKVIAECQEQLGRLVPMPDSCLIVTADRWGSQQILTLGRDLRGEVYLSIRMVQDCIELEWPREGERAVESERAAEAGVVVTDEEALVEA